MEPAAEPAAAPLSRMEELTRCANTPLNLEIRKPDGTVTTLISKIPTFTTRNPAEEWALHVINRYMSTDDTQYELATILKRSSEFPGLINRTALAIPHDEWNDERNWANKFLYRLCTFFYNKETGKIMLTHSDENSDYSSIYANYMFFPKDLLIASVILTVANLYKISDPVLDNPTTIVKIAVDLYFNRNSSSSLAFHKDSGTNLDEIQTPHSVADYPEAELLNYASLLFLSESRILRGTAFMQTAPIRGATRNACSMSVVPNTTVLFNDRLLQHATPHIDILEAPETMYSKTTLKGEQIDAVIVRRPRHGIQHKTGLKDIPYSGTFGVALRPFVHLAANPYSFTEEEKSMLMRGFDAPRSFLRGHYSFELFAHSKRTTRNPIAWGHDLKTFIETHMKTSEDNVPEELTIGIPMLLASKDDTSAEKDQKFYTGVNGITRQIDDESKIDDILRQISISKYGLGKKSKNKRKKTKRKRTKRTRTRTKRKRKRTRTKRNNLHY